MQTKPYLATGAVTHTDGEVQRIEMHLMSRDDIDASMSAELVMLRYARRLGHPVRNVAVLDVQAAG